MSRYVSRPRASWCEDEVSYENPFCPSLEVDGPGETDTGLVDASGNPIFRLQAPIGFGRDGEW